MKITGLPLCTRHWAGPVPVLAPRGKVVPPVALPTEAALYLARGLWFIALKRPDARRLACGN